MLSDVSHGSLSALACLGALESCRLWGGWRRQRRWSWRKVLATLCSASWSRLSLPAASRHAPVAPDCLIGTFQVRRPDKPGQSTQTVIHLFSSRRCSCPPFLSFPRGVWRRGGVRVIWSQDREKPVTNYFFSMKHSKKRAAIFYVVILLTHMPIHHSQ